MTRPDMRTTVYGKWILAGEHAVLRGGPALAFPLHARSLSLHYLDDGNTLSVNFQDSNGNDMRAPFTRALDEALKKTGQSHASVRGRFALTSSIPVGSGLGSSAALCVAIGRWFEWKGWLKTSEMSDFCREIENLFHGESSGLDIEVALTGRGVHFERRGERYSVEPLWKPCWYVSDSGQTGATSDCVVRVKDLWRKDASLGALIDRDMGDAVKAAEAALLENSADTGFGRLADAINHAHSCFKRWNLGNSEVERHIQMLLSNGAAAVKPTGSGNGGYVLSLWRTPPPSSLSETLIPA